MVRDSRRQSAFASRAVQEARHHARLQDRCARRRTADATDQLAKPGQRAEGFQAHRRGTGGPDQLVRANADDDAVRRLQDGRVDARRLGAYLQHGEWRAAVRLCQGRPDHPHHADRVRRCRSAALDDRGARTEIHAAAQDDARPARAELEIDHLFARPAAVSAEAGRLRSRRARAIRTTAASRAMSASVGTRRSTPSQTRSSA